MVVHARVQLRRKSRSGGPAGNGRQRAAAILVAAAGRCHLLNAPAPVAARTDGWCAPDQEAGAAGELVPGLRDDLDDELLGDERTARLTGLALCPVVLVLGVVAFQQTLPGGRHV